MDQSTAGVTLYAAFVLDVAAMYTGLGSIATPLREMVKELDPDEPRRMVPIELYNRACKWVEDTFGELSIRDAGRRIGDRSYKGICERTGVSSLRPSGLMRELARSARISIHDTHGRGWEILADEPRRIVMRRTQTFNCMLQEGLLLALLDRTGAVKPKLVHQTCTRRGDEYCDYVLTWTAEKR